MWEEQKSDPLDLAAHEHLFCSSHIVTLYCVSITEQTMAKSYLFVKYSLCSTPPVVFSYRYGVVDSNADYVL
jgi:hypothetical protein